MNECAIVSSSLYKFNPLNRNDSSGSRNPQTLVYCCITKTEGPPLKSEAASSKHLSYCPNSPWSFHFLSSQFNCDSAWCFPTKTRSKAFSNDPIAAFKPVTSITACSWHETHSLSVASRKIAKDPFATPIHK